MNNAIKTAINIVIAILVILLIVFAANKLPVDMQALIALMFAMVCAEGIGFKSVADFQENTNPFMLYIPLVRHYKIGDIMEYAGNPLLGKIRLPFYTLIITVMLYAAYYFVEAGTLKAYLLLAFILVLLIHILVRSIYYYIITSKLTSRALALSTLLVIPQTIIILFVFPKKIKELGKYAYEDEDEIEYEDED